MSQCGPTTRVGKGIRYVADKLAVSAAQAEAILREACDHQVGIAHGDLWGEYKDAYEVMLGLLTSLHGDVESMLEQLYAGIGEATVLLAHVDAAASPSESFPCQIPGTTGPGFADLPEVIQSHILALHLTGCPAGRSCGVRGVSKFFNSCAWLHDRAQQQLDIASDQIACLPYLPCLQAVVCSKPEMSVSGFVHRVLRFPMPHLVSLTLQCQCMADAPSLVATVARFPQLTELSLAVEVNVEDYEPQLQATPPLTLPDLTCLRSLSIHQPCVQSLAGSTVLAISMAALSGMHMLTRLHVRLNSVDAFEDQGWLDLTTTPTMIPVSRSLGKFSELRELVLSFWDSYAVTHGPLVDSCWQAFAEVLPTLQHLTRLGMISMLVGNHPTWQQALVSGLYGAPSLRHLALTGYSRFPLIDHGLDAGELAGLHEASAILARTLGSLTALTQLELADLQQGLGVHDCYVHLRTLTALRSLTLDVLPLKGELASRVTSISSMLACMPQLTSLVFRCISCDDYLVRHMSSNGAPCEHTSCSRCRTQYRYPNTHANA